LGPREYVLQGNGYDEYGGSGYKGIQGLYEVLRNTNAMCHAIMQEKGTDEIREIAISEGMFMLCMDGLVKVERGITTIDEVVKETTAVD
jgi:type II secretory ATPase GspE/PulE/Tfp pilus assembly ATPase PilB-like protein